jgi:hypothetical protein
MSEGRHGSDAAASLEEVAAAVSAALPPPPLASVLAFAATDADAGGGAAAAYFFDDASTIGSAGDASTLVLDSWLRDDRDGHFYCPRHPEQRKPYRPHRNSICAECLAESQRARQSLEQRKRVVEQKLQRLMDDKMAKDDDEQGDESTSPNRSSSSNGETNVDPSNPGGARFGGSDALNRVDVVMKDWTNSSLRRPAPPQDNKSEPSAPARPPEHADREEALKFAEGAHGPPPPPPIVDATFHYSPPSSHPQHPPEPHVPQPPPRTGYPPSYEYYAYAPPSAGPSPFNNGQYPSHPPHLSHNLPGYMSDAPPPPAVSHHPTYATPQIPPQHQAPPEYPPHASTAAHASHMHPSYSEVPSHSNQQGGWAATATYGSPAPAAAPAAPAAVPDAFVGHLFHMMERQDGMLVQKIKECDDLKKALDEVTSQIHELRVDNAQLRERVGLQGEQMRHELDLIRREVAAAAPSATATTSRPQHVHRTPSPPRGMRMRRNRSSSAEDDAQVAEEPRTPLLLADSPPRAREDRANNVARDVLEMAVETDPTATSNESPFLSEENKKDLSGVKLEPRRQWTSSSPSGPDLSPPVQWFPFRSEDVKDCPFTVFVDDDNDFHDPFGVGAGAIAFVAPKKGALASLKPAPATTNTAAPAAVAASHRQDIDWERSELAV